jgi:periplasmic copper chaperone A
MTMIHALKHRSALALFYAFFFSVTINMPRLALAHSFEIGQLSIEHPYATITPPGLKNGAVYFRLIKNSGTQADRLLSATTDAAKAVELHVMKMEANIMRMRELSAIDLPPKSELPFKHHGELNYHLMLVGLKQPLKDGGTFKINLKFEKAGEKEVTVNIQKTKEAAHDHKHH